MVESTALLVQRRKYREPDLLDELAALATTADYKIIGRFDVVSGPSSKFGIRSDKAEEIKSNLNRFLSDRDLSGACSQSLKAFGNIFIVDSIDTAVAAANSLAPEHVEVMCRDSDSVAGQITNAGAVFVGDYSPEPVGDYYCGSNHILPTGGTARFSSGLTVMDFMRSYSVVKYTRDALQSHSSTILSLIRPEGMRAHMLSIETRGTVQEKAEPQKLS